MKFEIVYEGDFRTKITCKDNNLTTWTDVPKTLGGKEEYLSPTDLLAGAVGACLASMMGFAAKKQRVDIVGTRIEIEKTMAKPPKMMVTSLKTRIIFPAAIAAGLNESARKALEGFARQCPVHHSLHPEIEAPIEFVYE